MKAELSRRAPARRCITDPTRTRRQLLTRLETWLARFQWEAYRKKNLSLAQLLHGELHFIGRHVKKNRREPCPACSMHTLERFLRWDKWENTNTSKTDAR